MEPLYPGLERTSGLTYVFLIHHEPSNTQLLFDLGMRKNFKTHLSPHLLKRLEPTGIQMSVERDVSEILEEHGVQPANIDTIIFSHHHFDHVGDTTKFPASTRLLVGPGYKARYLPGYPTDPDAVDTTADLYEGRETVELDFADSDPRVSEIGGFKAFDYFGDGSFYVLNTPGHTADHLSALARTTAGPGDDSTFMFLGGDIVHSCTVFRPTDKFPLPVTITPAPNAAPSSTTSCPGDVFARIHRLHGEADGARLSRTTPFCHVAGPEVNLAESQRNADKLAAFDGEHNIFTVYAHDSSLRDVVEYFPKTANDWRSKGWAHRGHWRFLAPMMKGIGHGQEE